MILTDLVEALSNSGNADAARLICQKAGLPYDMSWIDQPAADCGAPAKPAAPLSPAAAKAAAPPPPLSPAAANPAASKSDWQKIVDQQKDIFKTVAKPAAPAPAADSNKKVKECPMCFEEEEGALWTKGNRKWMLLDCGNGHPYCSVCVQGLLSKQMGCPSCKQPITKGSPIHFG